MGEKEERGCLNLSNILKIVRKRMTKRNGEELRMKGKENCRRGEQWTFFLNVDFGLVESRGR